MKQRISVFIEYKIKEHVIEQYESQMERVLFEMKKAGITNLSWMKAYDQPFLYVESFDVSSIEAYKTIKAQRLQENHAVYGELHSLIHGGVGKIHCWAFLPQGSVNR
ncbi:hypothetical protein A374_13295 [Fictibacillus macauensis ZFHKF-1]|uniref:NIPSNAP domain-containing protein n=1 Tax=Fictibacillus macauensis ZFHKF-1 TaxID=1196324 RepID=I8AGX2_9BACL|nr:hypothetical protein [Fictibacillus macauensis]EIT84669.1 hypothetical protein A374_13295 [Fictibacillus macauensis ZFHKF-1]